jgi:EF-P beta-lysylation protein EpmB
MGQMKRAIRDSHQLVSAVGLADSLGDSVIALPRFPTFVPPSLLARIQSGNPDDPILRQVLPLIAEDDSQAQDGFLTDPLAEFRLAAESSDSSGPAPNRQHQWIKKYHGRALLITTGACGVHCRYCFRRHFPYPAAPQQRTRWQPWLEPIAADASIREVILSGGDPLVLSDASLERLCRGLREIPHVRWIRIHSRMPVVIPQRVTAELLSLFEGFTSKTMVIHANHAQELDESVARAVADLRTSGFHVLNQAVLLKGVNDSVSALADLSCRLIECGVTPYYLHQLDRVRGAAHFEVPLAHGLELITQLRNQLPGYAIPRYVQEIPGQPSKTVLA